MAKEVKKNNKSHKQSPKKKIEKKEVVEEIITEEEIEEPKIKKVDKTKSNKKIKEKEKKKYSTFQAAFVALLVILIFVLAGITAYKEISTYLDSKKIMDEFYEVFEGKESSVIFYSATGCHYCELEKPILDQIARDYDFEYLEIDYTKLTEEQHKKIQEELGVDGSTPTTLVVKNGKVRSKQVGYVDGNKFVQFFIKSEFLPEGSTYIPEENLTFISYEEFKELSKSKDPKVITIGGATCEYCITAKPILSNLANAYDIDIYYITLDYFSADERLSLTADLEEFGYDEETFVEKGSYNTPSVIIIKNEKVVAYEVGLGNLTSYTKLFKDNGVIKD